MSGDSTHGVGAGACAKAELANAVIAVAASSVLIDNGVILQSPNIHEGLAQGLRLTKAQSSAASRALNKSRTRFVRQYGSPAVRDFVIPRSVLDDYLPIAI
jgi:hypothetical protein